MHARVALDHALFTEAGWFALDVDNHKVPGVRPGTLEAGLALVGRGRVATVVGRLRAGVVAVDVDAGGQVGDLVTRVLAAWCRDRGVWHLTRPSGGGPGRWHVFCVPGPHAGGLGQLLVELRGEHGLSAQALDERRAIRPLSAPHRRGGSCPPVLAPTQAMVRALRTALGPGAGEVPRAGGEGGAGSPGASGPPAGGPPGGGVEAAGSPPRRPSLPAALVAMPRRAREVAPHWQRYLDTGRVPDRADEEPGVLRFDRSLVERHATHALVVAGMDEAAAWAAITAAAPTAFTKARGRGRGWWRRHVWNDAVTAADAWRSTHPGPCPTAAGQGEAQVAAARAVTSAAVRAGRAWLEARWTSWGPRERHSVRVVAEALLERMERTGSTRVPCPERDLLLDTPIASRTTIRAALRRLEVLGFGQRLETYRVPPRAGEAAAAGPDGEDPGAAGGGQEQAVRDARSHLWQLDARFTEVGQAPGEAPQDPSPGACGGAVRGLAPPKSHTPPPPGCWRVLGLVARHAWLALAATTGSGAVVPLSELARRAGLIHSPDASATVSQLRTLTSTLQLLARHGLAFVDEHGNWHAHSTTSTEPLPPVPPAQLFDPATTQPSEPEPEPVAAAPLSLEACGMGASALAQARITQAVARDRAAYGAFLHRRDGRGAWQHARQAALARQARSDHARQRAWWQNLPPAERTRRSLQRAQRFAAAPIADQQALKEVWAQRRRRASGWDDAGESEAVRHDAWATSFTDLQWADRVAERTARYQALPRPAQVAAATAWATHRRRHHIPRGRPEPAFAKATPPADPAPATVPRQLLPPQPRPTPVLAGQLTLNGLDRLQGRDQASRSAGHTASTEQEQR